MNRTQTIFAIAALASATVIWQIGQWQTVPDPALSAALPSGTTESTTFARADEPIIRPDNPATDRDPSRTTEVETEEVLGLRVRKDRKCTLAVDQYPDPETSELRNIYSCTPDEPAESDPYESWDDRTLAGMAYGDAHAAQVLGLRHVVSEDPQVEALGISLLYRSVALSGDPEVFHEAIGRRYAYVEVNGELQLDNLKQMLVFNLIGEVLGDERFSTDQILQTLRSADFPEQEIEAIQTGTRRVLERMASLQTEMTGDATIREALDNA